MVINSTTLKYVNLTLAILSLILGILIFPSLLTVLFGFFDVASLSIVNKGSSWVTYNFSMLIYGIWYSQFWSLFPLLFFVITTSVTVLYLRRLLLYLVYNNISKNYIKEYKHIYLFFYYLILLLAMVFAIIPIALFYGTLKFTSDAMSLTISIVYRFPVEQSINRITQNLPTYSYLGYLFNMIFDKLTPLLFRISKVLLIYILGSLVILRFDILLLIMYYKDKNLKKSLEYCEKFILNSEKVFYKYRFIFLKPFLPLIHSVIIYTLRLYRVFGQYEKYRNLKDKYLYLNEEGSDEDSIKLEFIKPSEKHLVAVFSILSILLIFSMFYMYLTVPRNLLDALLKYYDIKKSVEVDYSAIIGKYNLNLTSLEELKEYHTGLIDAFKQVIGRVSLASNFSYIPLSIILTVILLVSYLTKYKLLKKLNTKYNAKYIRIVYSLGLISIITSIMIFVTILYSLSIFLMLFYKLYIIIVVTLLSLTIFTITEYNNMMTFSVIGYENLTISSLLLFILPYSIIIAWLDIGTKILSNIVGSLEITDNIITRMIIIKTSIMLIFGVYVFLGILNMKIYEGYSHFVFGKKYFNDHDFKSSAELFSKFIEEYKDIVILGQDKLLEAYKILGDSYFNLKRYNDAKKVYEELYTLAKTHDFEDMRWYSSYRLGLIHELKKDYKKAYKYYKESIKTLESIRELIRFIEYRKEFIEGKDDVYVRMILTCLKLDKSEEAFEYVERLKSRTLIEVLANKEIKIKNTTNHYLKKKEKELITEIRRIELKLLEKRKASEKRKLRLKLKELKLEYERVLSEIRKVSPEYYSIRTVDPISLEELQKILGDYQLVEFFTNEESIIVFLISKDKFDYIKINIDRATLKDIENFKVVIRERGNEIYEILEKLGEKIVSPIKDKLKFKLIIVPHGYLYNIPFHALIVDKKYLIQSHLILYMPSASTLKFIKQKTDEKSILVVGNPTKKLVYIEDLKHAEAEAIEIAKIYGVKPLIGSEAKKEIVIREAKNKDLIHLACHALFDNECPPCSRLLLADGDLTVGEIYNLDLNASLTVLSACETGIVGLKGGGEIEGFIRAFFYAGCSRIVVSLWIVDDTRTRILFRKFYSKKNKKFSERLRESQLEIIKYNLHPYFWAGFVMFGID